MSTRLSTTELKRLTADELRREIAAKRLEVAKMRLGLELQKDKNHALYRRTRREIPRMLTVLAEVEKVKTGDQTAKKSVESTSKVAENPVKDAGSAKKVTKKPAAKKPKKAA